MSEVAEIKGGAAVEVPGIFAMIERAASNPDADADKIERLYAIYQIEQDRAASRAYNASMNDAQARMPKVTNDSVNSQTHSRYAKHEKIVEEAGPIWIDAGFSLSFSEGEGAPDGQVRIVCVCMHRDGHTERHHLDLDLDNKGIKGSVNKTDVHAKSSTMSYGQRILTCKIFNIPTGDDKDGNGPVDRAIYITSDQADQVHDIIADHPDEQFGVRLLAWLEQNGVDSVEHIPAKQWNKYLAEIKKAAK